MELALAIVWLSVIVTVIVLSIYMAVTDIAKGNYIQNIFYHLSMYGIIVFLVLGMIIL